MDKRCAAMREVKGYFQCVQIQCRPKNDTSCDGDQKRDNHRVLYHSVEEIN